MRWTDEGSTTFLASLVFRFLRPIKYDRGWTNHLYGTATVNTDFGIEVIVTARGGSW